jgi:hypothetical protein
MSFCYTQVQFMALVSGYGRIVDVIEFLWG